MKRNRFRLLVGVSAAFLAVASLTGTASAQSGLGTRLDDAGQKLDSDTQSCRPVNLAEYATLLNEAMANKQRADKAAKKGIPVDQAQVASDLGKASMLFARAQAAQAMQCMRAAQQQAQPQAQAHSTGAAPTAAVVRPQGVTPGDEVAVAQQQGTIDEFEKELSELQSLVKAGQCKAAWDLVDDLDDWLDELDSPIQARPVVNAAYRPRVPASLIDEWDERIDELIKDCPRPGMLDYKQVRLILDITNGERAQYGLDPYRWSPKLADHAQTYAEELKRVGQMSHAPREGRGTERENLSQGLPWWSVQQHLESWRQEKKKFKPGIFPNVSFTGNWFEVGHWTQWIWENTVAVGCAMAVGGPASWFVCRYNPGGNKDGVAVGIPPARVAVVQQPALPSREVFKSGASSVASSVKPLESGGAWLVRENELLLDNLIASDARLDAFSGLMFTPPGALISSEIIYSGWNSLEAMTPQLDAVDWINDTMSNTWIRPRLIGGDYGKVEQPDVSHYGAQFATGSKLSKTPATKVGFDQLITVPARRMFFAAERNYEGAKAAGNIALMNSADADMKAAIAWVRFILGQANAAADMGLIDGGWVKWELRYLETEYNLTTTGDEKGILLHTDVEQPKLQHKEPFKTPEPKPGELDPG